MRSETSFDDCLIGWLAKCVKITVSQTSKKDELYNEETVHFVDDFSSRLFCRRLDLSDTAAQKECPGRNRQRTGSHELGLDHFICGRSGGSICRAGR